MMVLVGIPTHKGEVQRKVGIINMVWLTSMLVYMDTVSIVNKEQFWLKLILQRS